MKRLSSLFEAIKLYGFAVIDDNHKDVLDELRNTGVIHLFAIRKVGRYTILEINTIGCERDCSISCRDGFGVVNGDCYSECIDNCLRDKLNMISRALVEDH
jgi:hypothetical protein